MPYTKQQLLDDLNAAPEFLPVNREQAEEILSSYRQGVYLVRLSSIPGCLAISVVANKKDIAKMEPLDLSKFMTDDAVNLGLNEVMIKDIAANEEKNKKYLIPEVYRSELGVTSTLVKLRLNQQGNITLSLECKHNSEEVFFSYGEFQQFIEMYDLIRLNASKYRGRYVSGEFLANHRYIDFLSEKIDVNQEIRHTPGFFPLAQPLPSHNASVQAKDHTALTKKLP